MQPSPTHQWLPRLRGDAAWVIAILFFFESAGRASVVTVFPINAYALLGNKEDVSLLYTLVAIAALLSSFAIPAIIRALSRRWSYSLGALCLAACGAMLATDTRFGQAGAMYLRTFGGALLNVTLSLYIMDNIAKGDLVRSEPLRFTVSTLAWIATPLLGVWLYTRYGIAATGAVPVAAAGALLAFFWRQRLSEKGPIRPGKTQPVNPLASIGRFVAQPRLRLAWLIAFSRSAFWVTFFVYVPILMIEGEAGPLAAGIAIALGSAMLLANAPAGGWARRHSLRLLLAIAFFGGFVLAIGAGVASAGHPLLAGGAMVAAAFFISMLDGLGPIPFLRAVRAHERAPMTTVYRTYLEISELATPFAYVFAFRLLGFPGAFWTLAALLGATGVLVLRHIPRRM
jgi:MFS family permease